jgi:hypothetical protein
MTNLKIRHSFRSDKNFTKQGYNNLCNAFAKLYVEHFKKVTGEDDIVAVEFGKQDIRGIPSITLFNSRHCVPHQNHFSNNKEMLSYMRGFIAANETRFI